MAAALSPQSFSRYGRLVIPYVVLFLFLSLSLVNIPLPYFSAVRPDFVLMAVFYWSIYRPTLVPPVLCFTLGVLVDFLVGVPVGLHAFLFVSVHWLIRDQRRFLMGQPYIATWAVFSVVSLAAAFWYWGVAGLLQMDA